MDISGKVEVEEKRNSRSDPDRLLSGVRPCRDAPS
jgi:hypothetical protein